MMVLGVTRTQSHSRSGRSPEEEEEEKRTVLSRRGFKPGPSPRRSCASQENARTTSGAVQPRSTPVVSPR
jgi:hypothetical protein